MDLNNLKKSISEMDESELLATLIQIRSDRRISRKPEAKKKNPMARKNIISDVQSMDKESLMKLLEALKGA
ncbi:conserved hypothetical protein [Azospirillaceae bacterium]